MIAVIGIPKRIGIDLVRSDDTGGQDPPQTNVTGDLARGSGCVITIEIGNAEEEGHEIQKTENVGRTGLGRKGKMTMMNGQRVANLWSSAMDHCLPKTILLP